MTFLFKLTFVCHLFFASYFSTLSTPLDVGWEYLNNGDVINAINSFDKASKEEIYKEEALLVLSMLYQRTDQKNKAIECFKQYFDFSKDPIPAAYVFLNEEFILTSKEFKDTSALENLNMLLTDERSKGKITGSLLVHKAIHHAYNYDENNSNNTLEQLNAIKEWSFLGPFDNIMNNGFDKDHGALQSSSLTKDFETLYGGKTNWFKPKYDLNYGFINIKSFFKASDILVYAQTFLDIEEDTEVLLNLGYSGSMKLWLNDQLIYSKKEILNTDVDEVRIKAKLKKGNNRLLVQIGDFKTPQPQFIIRVTDDSLNKINYKNKHFLANHNKEVSPFEIIDNYAVKHFKSKHDENPNDLLSILLLAKCYFKIGDYDLAEYYYKKLEDINPNNYFLIRDLVLLYKDSGNNTFQSKYYEKFEQLYPNDKEVLENKMEELLKEQNKLELKSVSEKFTSLYSSDLSKLNVEIKNKTLEEDYLGIISIINDYYVKYSYNPEIVLGKYNVVKSMEGRDKAISILEKTNKKVYNHSLFNQLLREYKDDGKYDEALGLIESCLKTINGSNYFYNEMIKIYSQKEDFKKAIEILDFNSQSRPSDYTLFSEKAKFYNILKEKENSTSSYREALTYYPFDFMLNEKLRDAQGKKTLLSYLEKVDPNLIVDDYVKNQIPDSSKWYEIIFQEFSLFENEWSARAKAQSYILRINNESAIEEWQRINMAPSQNFNINVKEIKAIKKNGNIINAEKHFNEYVFVNLEVGDYIFISYVETMKHGGKSSKFFNELFSFDAYVPVYNRSYSLITEKENSVAFKNINTDFSPQIEKIDGLTFYTWKKESKLLKEELYSVPYGDITEGVHVVSNQTWEDIVTWYIDLSEEQIKEDYTIKQVVKELNLDSYSSDLKKAQVIYNFILENIQYSSIDFRQSNFIPQKASDVYHTRLGDCKDVSTLFTAIARAVGLKAHLVLINTSNNGQNSIILPSIDFNHCIVKLIINDENIYLELTDPYLPFGHLNTYHYNANILDINLNSNEKCELKKLDFNVGYTNEIKRKTQVDIDNATTLKISTNSTKSGHLSGSQANSYLFLNQTEKNELIKNVMSSRFKSQIADVNIVFDNLQKRNPVQHYSFEFSVPSEFIKVGSFKSFKIPFTDLLAENNSFNLEERSSSFDYKFYETSDYYEEEITISTPEGVKFIDIPNDIMLSYKDFNYKLSFDEINKNSLIVKRSFNTSLKTIYPNDYPEFRSFILKVIEAENTYLAIK